MQTIKWIIWETQEEDRREGGTIQAKAVLMVLKKLLQKDENGDTALKKVLLILLAVVLVIILLMGAVVEVFLIPVEDLPSFFENPAGTIIKTTIDNALTRPTLKTGEEGIFALPTTQNYANYFWGYTASYGSGRHEGVDFSVPMGTEVVAIGNGTVIETGVNKSYGTYILIEHKIEYVTNPKDSDEDEEEDYEEEIETFYLYSFYAHLYKSYVFRGQKVSKQQGIATSGGDNSKHFAGNSTGAHLHLEIRTDTSYGTDINPVPYVLQSVPEKEKKRYTIS